MAKELFLRVDCVSLPVKDLEAALAFYRDRLGHELVWRTNEAAGLMMADSKTELVLRIEDRPPETDIYVGSVEAAVKRFVAAGGSIVFGPFDIRIGKCAVVADPWGNQLVMLDSTRGLLRTDEKGYVIE